MERWENYLTEDGAREMLCDALGHFVGWKMDEEAGKAESESADEDMLMHATTIGAAMGLTRAMREMKRKAAEIEASVGWLETYTKTENCDAAIEAGMAALRA